MQWIVRTRVVLVLLAFSSASALAESRSIVTAQSVEQMAVGGNPFAIESRVSFAPFFGLLLPGGCLGHLGPLGAAGPLSMMGPLSPVAFSPVTIFQTIGNFQGYSKLLTLKGGPMSAAGPLGPNGPLSMYESLSDPSVFPSLFPLNPFFPPIASFTNQLQAGGVLAPLGPLGPMSPLGPFGPLGPLGDHGGFSFDRSGTYHDGRGQVRRTVTATFGDHREFELVENYEESFAQRMRDNDTSFTVSGTSPAGQVKRFLFKSASDQIVTIVAVPGAPGQIWSLRLSDARGAVAQSASSVYVNWIQVQVRRGENFAADIVSNQSGPYRLYVVGSGPDINSFEVTIRR